METNSNQPATPSRVVFIRSPRQMSEEQLRAALSSMDPDDPRWLAINQIVDRELASAVLDSSAPDLDATKGTYPGGRVAALGELKKMLHDYREAPITKPAPPSAKVKPRARR